MEDTTHNHYFIFNDDGFEVCSFCGVCTSQREMKTYLTSNMNDEEVSNFSDILRNHNIGYVSEIEKLYGNIKKK